LDSDLGDAAIDKQLSSVDEAAVVGRRGIPGDATALRPLGDDTLVNMSVWKDVAA
jgi:hypothetical protein